MTWRIIQGNILDTLSSIEPGTVDACVTSPPYWQLRSYLPKGHELKKFELGSEPTIAEYIANQVEVMRGVRNALAEHGTVWLNVGDTYSGGGRGGNPQESSFRKQATNTGSLVEACPETGLDSGNLCLIPQRLMIALQEDGWYVRSVVIWAKPSPMPASLSGWKWQRCRVKVKSNQSGNGKYAGAGITHIRGSNVSAIGGADWQDCPGCPKCEPTGGYVLRRGSWRPTSSYEPVIMLAKSAKYFADGEPVKTPPKSATVSRDQYTRVLDDADEQFAVKHDHETNAAAGANLRDVWTIASESLHEKHYAAFPTKLVMQCLKASVSEKGYCPTCGKPWVRMVDSEYDGGIARKEPAGDRASGPMQRLYSDGSSASQFEKVQMGFTDSKTIGWRPACQCEELHCTSCSFFIPYGKGEHYASRRPGNQANLPSGMGKEEIPFIKENEGENKIPKEEIRASLQTMPKEIQGPEKLGILQPEMLREMDVGERSCEQISSRREAGCDISEGIPPVELEGRETKNQERLHSDSKAGTSKRGQKRVRVRAPSRNERASRATIGTVGEGSSHQCHQGRQPDREPETGDTQDPLRGNSLSVLPSCVSYPIACPECGSKLEIIQSKPRPGLVLDPFCGSGRTGVAARRLGLDFVGCELNPEYIEMANRRIEGALRDHKRPPKEKKSGDLFASLGDPS